MPPGLATASPRRPRKEMPSSGALGTSTATSIAPSSASPRAPSAPAQGFSRGYFAFSSTTTRDASSGAACASASAVVVPAGPPPTMTTSRGAFMSSGPRPSPRAGGRPHGLAMLRIATGISLRSGPRSCRVPWRARRATPFRSDRARGRARPRTPGASDAGSGAAATMPVPVACATSTGSTVSRRPPTGVTIGMAPYRIA